MSHARQQIREAVETLLGTIVGLTVFASRQTEKYDENDLPAATVSTLSERMLEETAVINSLETSREIIITVELRAKHTTGIDDELDALAVSVEDVLGADETLGGLIDYFSLTQTDIEIDDGSLDRPVGLATLTYAGVYRVSASDVETIL
jgi:hypothetical protein